VPSFIVALFLGVDPVSQQHIAWKLTEHAVAGQHVEPAVCHYLARNIDGATVTRDVIGCSEAFRGFGLPQNVAAYAVIGTNFAIRVFSRPTSGLLA